MRAAFLSSVDIEGFTGLGWETFENQPIGRKCPRACRICDFRYDEKMKVRISPTEYLSPDALFGLPDNRVDGFLSGLRDGSVRMNTALS